MNTQFGFIFKVLVLSLALSFVVKYGGRLLPVAATDLNALIGISVLPLMMLVALRWRSRQSI
jgi:hypothetical protein